MNRIIILLGYYNLALSLDPHLREQLNAFINNIFSTLRCRDPVLLSSTRYKQSSKMFKVTTDAASILNGLRKRPLLLCALHNCSFHPGNGQSKQRSSFECACSQLLPEQMFTQRPANCVGFHRR